MATSTPLPDWIATVHDFQTYWFMDLGKEYEAAIKGQLVRTWPTIQLALNSGGQGSCQLGDGMVDVLRELHIIRAMVMFNIAGVRLSVDQRTLYNDMLVTQLSQLADGTLIVCRDTTADSVPVSGRVVNYG